MKEKRQLNMHEIYHLVIHNTLGKASSEAQYQQMIDALSSLDLGATATANSTSSSDQIIASDKDFIYLPRFVREPLNQMRLAHNHQALDDAIAEFVKLVPNEFHRKFYLRIFKWTIAFATWNHPNQTLLTIQQTIYPYSSQYQLNSMTSPQNQPYSTPTGTFSPNRSNAMSGFLLPQFQDSVPKPSPSKRKEERRFSFSSSLRKYSPPPTSPGKSPNKGKGGFGFATSPMSPTSPMRTGTSRTLRFSPNMSSPMGSPTLQGAANSTNHIPFSQRQSKSKVAAREILKKGESKFKHVSKAEQMILEVVQDYDRFQKKVRPTTFKG